MTLADLERLLHVERTVAPSRTRADIDRIRRQRLSKPWRGQRARRKQT